MVIEVEGLTKEYEGIQALKGIHLSIEAGGVVGLLGPNGAGKTTLIETLEGLRAPTSGRVSVLGLDPTRQPRELRERIGAQLQSTPLPLELTPLETLRLFSSLYRKGPPPGEVLTRLDLVKQAGSRNSTLSGGQKRRLAIAMALINDPELVLLDEPTSGLDPLARREIHGLLAELRAAGRTVLLSTHYVEEAEQLCDRVVMLRAGEIVADGSPFELVSRTGGTSVLWVAVEGEFDPAPLLRAGAVDQGREGSYHRFTTPDPGAAIVALGKLLGERAVSLVDLRMKRPNLEDLYLELMGGRPAEHEGEP